MKELLHARAMESICRQRASFFPEESWKFLAEAEMWKHRALDLIIDHHVDCNQSAPPDATEPSCIQGSH
ncbi:hypothetical protein [Tardiphaga robiniae]|uniref:hypothetical protein n=1 Tax=Tardiphaga robiniae TaxID=943830 RepID=UPI001111F1C5|nr:hypothetical protein [Tardiphaga robiniae]